MFRLNDFILLLVIFSSMLAGILFPRHSSIFQPYPVYLMMFLLFLSFSSIQITTILHTVKKNVTTILYLSFVKMILLPISLYLLFRLFFPSYAIAALLLTGISTGVVAPFISTLVQANLNLVLVMVVLSSPLVPFTLPALVKILLERSIEISFLSMMKILCMVVFVPILSLEILRRFSPGTLDRILKRRYPISLTIFGVINLGVFSKYSDFFFQNPLIILKATFIAFLLAAIYLVVGIAILWRSPVENQLASAITLGNMNNVLVLVFASEFFGPLEPTVAALYMIPFFAFILPMRFYYRYKKNQENQAL